jgi:chromosome partitioning protein
MTMYDSRTKLSEQVVAEVRRYFGPRVYDTVIPRTVRLSEAPGFGLPITIYDPNSKGAKSYRKLAEEFLRREATDLPLPDEEPPPIIAIERTEGAAIGEETEPAGPVAGLGIESLPSPEEWATGGNGQTEGGEES